MAPAGPNDPTVRFFPGDVGQPGGCRKGGIFKIALRNYRTIFSNLQIIVFLINMCYSAVDVISRKYAEEGGNQEMKIQVEEICKNF
jgi:hypothetical protein